MKKELLKFLVLAMLAAGAGPVSAAVWQWSKTAATNGTADGTINWAEGMSPSSVNDSARATMARLAEWRDDISGSVVAGGTSTAYTVATNQAAGGNGIGSPPTNGQMLAFLAATTNGASATLAVDGGTAYPLYSAAGFALPAASLVSGTPYRVSYNVANSGWIVEGTQNNPYSVPLGGIISSTIATAPNSSFVLAAGQCLSTTTYATYWVAYGSPAPGSCAAGQFQVLDLRGRTLAGLDNLGGSAANRMTAAATGCGVAFTSIGTACGLEFQTLVANQIPAVTFSGVSNSQNSNHTHQYTSPGTSGSTTGGGGFALYNAGSSAFTTNTSAESANHQHAFSGAINGGGAAHPIVQPTVAVNYMIRVL